MKFGFRTPSLKLPRGAGWLSGAERAARNRIYQRTTVDPVGRAGMWMLIVLAIGAAVVLVIF